MSNKAKGIRFKLSENAKENVELIKTLHVHAGFQKGVSKEPLRVKSCNCQGMTRG